MHVVAISKSPSRPADGGVTRGYGEGQGYARELKASVGGRTWVARNTRQQSKGCNALLHQFLMH